jgi:hypothetical protein
MSKQARFLSGALVYSVFVFIACVLMYFVACASAGKSAYSQRWKRLQKMKRSDNVA